MTRAPALPARKSLGQHFLHDQNVLHRIAELARPAAGSGLIEIGPGTGNLTAHLLEVLPPEARLLTLERDRRMRAVLFDRFGDRVEVLEGDAAEADFAALLGRPELGPQPVVVGNLPYYAAVPILFAVLGEPDAIPAVRPDRLVVMVQREMADRIVARPSTADYGQLSVKLQMLADVQLALKVGRGAFSPPPKVESAVLVLRPLPALRHAVPDAARFSALVTAGFQQRRKVLANALGAAGVPAERTRAALRDLGLDERARAEELSVPQWARLATLLHQAREDAPAAGT